MMKRVAVSNTSKPRGSRITVCLLDTGTHVVEMEKIDFCVSKVLNEIT